jgi:hypothetical protein
MDGGSIRGRGVRETSKVAAIEMDRATQMLIYLDSAHFDLLERATESDAKEFWSSWEACGCELALSLHHMQEIGQLSDRGSAQRRIKVLERFSTIRSCGGGFDRVRSLEVQAQIYRHAGYEVDVQQVVRGLLFPVSPLEMLVSSLEVQPEFKQLRAALEMAAEAENLSKEATRQGSAMNLDAPIDPSTINSAEAEQLLETVLADVPQEVALLMRQMYERVRAQILEQGTVRKGLETLYGLQDVVVRGSIPDSDLAGVATFFNVARDQVGGICSRVGMERSNGEQLVLRLDPYHSPGVALQLAAQRARHLHPKPDEPGDQVDVAHLAFAPYVDLAFVDRRTLGFITQEARDRPHLLAPEFTKNIVRAGTLDRVAEVILRHSHQ